MPPLSSTPSTKPVAPTIPGRPIPVAPVTPVAPVEPLPVPPPPCDSCQVASPLTPEVSTYPMLWPTGNTNPDNVTVPVGPMLNPDVTITSPVVAPAGISKPLAVILPSFETS